MGGNYWGLNFFTFLKTLFLRAISWPLNPGPLSMDEMQVMVLVLLGISCSILGALLVLRKMTMLANSISHTVLFGIVIAYVLVGGSELGGVAHAHSISMPILLLASLISSLLTVVFSEFLHRVLRVQKDASIGLVFTLLFALGIVLVTLFTRNSHIGVEVIMGNIDMLSINDLYLAIYLAIGNILLFALFYKEFVTTSFDPCFSKLSGIPPFLFTFLLMFQTSATIIAGLRAVGVVLILSLLVVPVLTARLLTRSVLKLMVVSSLISALCAIVAVAVSRHFLSIYELALSTSGLFVTCQFLFWFSTVAILRQKAQKAPRKISCQPTPPHGGKGKGVGFKVVD